MKIADFSLKPYSIPYSPDLSWRPGVFDERAGSLVIATADDTNIGIGDIAPLDSFSREGILETRNHAEAAIGLLRGSDVPPTFNALQDTLKVIPNDPLLPPSAVFGIETALADLAAKAAGIPLAQWIDEGALKSVPVNTLLTGDLEEMKRRIPEKRRKGFKAYKIKVGEGKLSDDREKVALARELLGGEVSLRLDANRAWTFEQAIRALRRLKEFRIEYIEEPLQRLDTKRIQALHERCGVDIALDESVQYEDRFDALCRMKGVSTVIIKPSIIGGLSKSLALARKSRRLGKDVVVTSIFESGVGVTACLHLAAALGKDVRPCGLDTLSYLEETLIREELPVRNGFIDLPPLPGLGVSLERTFLDP